MYNTKYSQCIKLLEFGDGLWLLAGHEPINAKAHNYREETEVQIAEKRLLCTLHRCSRARGFGVHVCYLNALPKNIEQKIIKPV